jgi:hypothetical protein
MLPFLHKQTYSRQKWMPLIYSGIRFFQTTGSSIYLTQAQSSSPGKVKNFLFSTLSRPALGSIQLPIQWVPGAISPGVKRPGREADHSPPASAEVKKMWTYTSLPPYAFMV